MPLSSSLSLSLSFSGDRFFEDARLQLKRDFLSREQNAAFLQVFAHSVEDVLRGLTRR